MSDTLTEIGQFLNSGAGKGLLTAGTAGAGLTQNLLANRQAEQKQNFVKDLITNPTKFAAFVKSFNQPLQQGLTADIDRSASAFGAEHGLGSSPAVMQDIEAQALAPYLQQQQQTAQQTALQSLGIYSNSPTTKPVDISSILKMLQMGGSQPNVTSGINLNNVPNPGINLTDAGFLPSALPSPVTDYGDYTP